MEEKSEALALCLFELQNCLLSLDAVSEAINNCIIVPTDMWRTWYWNQKCRSFVNLSWENKWAISRSGMFIYMSALIFNLSFNLIWRIGFFFRSLVKNDFFLCHERAWNFLSIVMYFKTWNFRHWWSRQYARWSFMYPSYVMAHQREIYSYTWELQIVKSDGLRFGPAFVTSK